MSNYDEIKKTFEEKVMDKYEEYSPGYVIDIFNKKIEEEFVLGNREVIPNVVKTTSDTLYDIASLTKVFTSVLVYMAYEEGKIDLNSTVYDLDNNFINLKDIKIIDLLSHNQNIWTDGYLGSVSNNDEFYKLLYTAYIKEEIPTYVDVHYIILSSLLEKIYRTDYKSLCTEKIFNKLNLESACFDPDASICASNNYENIDGKVVEDILPGLTHDTKGRVAKSFGIYLGHASIFITGKDLLKFLKSFFDYSLLKKETIDFTLQHRNNSELNYEILKKMSDKINLNEMYEDVISKNNNVTLIKYINNMGVLYKNDIDILNDIPKKASDNSIFFSGYTGPMFVVDFQNKVIIVVMCNAIHNSHYNREQRKQAEVEIIDICYDIYTQYYE